jgi:hypothetical protein
MTYDDFDAMLEREAQIMGRGVTYINGWEFQFTKRGEDHAVRVLVYDCDPLVLNDTEYFETRVATYIDGHPGSSAIVSER